MRKPALVLAGAAALLSAPFVASPFAGASDSGALTAAPAPAGDPCTLRSAECGDALGDAIVISKLPAGFTEQAAPAAAVAANPDATARMRVFEATEKPWIGPGGPVGRRIIVTVRPHAPNSRSADLEAGQMPGGRVVALGDNQALVADRVLPLRGRAGARTDVVLSNLVTTTNDRVGVSLTGEGVTLDELLAFAATVEVR